VLNDCASANNLVKNCQLFYAPKDLIQKEKHDLRFSPNSILNELSDFVLEKKTR